MNRRTFRTWAAVLCTSLSAASAADVKTKVVLSWPTDPAVLEGVNAIVMYNALGGNVLLH